MLNICTWHEEQKALFSELQNRVRRGRRVIWYFHNDGSVLPIDVFLLGGRFEQNGVVRHSAKTGCGRMQEACTAEHFSALAS